MERMRRRRDESEATINGCFFSNEVTALDCCSGILDWNTALEYCFGQMQSSDKSEFLLLAIELALEASISGRSRTLPLPYRYSRDDG